VLCLSFLNTEDRTPALFDLSPNSIALILRIKASDIPIQNVLATVRGVVIH
jgi:hypothetical protein